jgi:hypothetical protein
LCAADSGRAGGEFEIPAGRRWSRGPRLSGIPWVGGGHVDRDFRGFRGSAVVTRTRLSGSRGRAGGRRVTAAFSGDPGSGRVRAGVPPRGAGCCASGPGYQACTWVVLGGPEASRLRSHRNVPAVADRAWVPGGRARRPVVVQPGILVFGVRSRALFLPRPRLDRKVFRRANPPFQISQTKHIRPGHRPEVRVSYHDRRCHERRPRHAHDHHPSMCSVVLSGPLHRAEFPAYGLCETPHSTFVGAIAW